MPVLLSYRDDGGVLIKGAGKLRGYELIQCNEEIYADEKLTQQVNYQICDFLEVEELIVSAGDIHQLAGQDKSASLSSGSLIIAIVAKESYHYGLSRMWQALSENEGLVSAIFSTMDEAERWIAESQAREAS